MSKKTPKKTARSMGKVETYDLSVERGAWTISANSGSTENQLAAFSSTLVSNSAATADYIIASTKLAVVHDKE